MKNTTLSYYINQQQQQVENKYLRVRFYLR